MGKPVLLPPGAESPKGGEWDSQQTLNIPKYIGGQLGSSEVKG